MSDEKPNDKTTEKGNKKSDNEEENKDDRRQDEKKEKTKNRNRKENENGNTNDENAPKITAATTEDKMQDKANAENKKQNQKTDDENEPTTTAATTDDEASKSARKSALRFAEPSDQQQSKPSTTPKAHSELFVLHTEKGNVTVTRHCHLPRSEGVNVRARRKLIVASVLCLIFTLCEVLGGILSNSLAVAADAAHTLTDFSGFMISLFAIWLAGRRSTDRLSFGWYRAEVIGALASIMTIWLVTAVLFWLAVQRCIHRNFEIKANIMIITAVFGIVTNIILGIYLGLGESKHTMTCDSDYCMHPHEQHVHFAPKQRHGFLKKLQVKFKQLFQKGKTVKDSKHKARPENLNIKAAYLHALSDGLQSVAVLIAAIIIYIKPTWVLADPICTFIFSVLILYTTFNIIKDIIVVLMEGTPNFIDYNAVKAIFEAIPGVKSVHHLRIWALTLEKIALAVHLTIERDQDPHEILVKAERAIHTHYKLFETTIQIEEEGFERATLVV